MTITLMNSLVLRISSPFYAFDLYYPLNNLAIQYVGLLNFDWILSRRPGVKKGPPGRSSRGAFGGLPIPAYAGYFEVELVQKATCSLQDQVDYRSRQDHTRTQDQGKHIHSVGFLDR
jgi:hypothetical protein